MAFAIMSQGPDSERRLCLIGADFCSTVVPDLYVTALLAINDTIILSWEKQP